MKRYQGSRLNHVLSVTVDGEPLSPRLDLQEHSPDSFEWGYGGSGPAQLALALLADALGDDDMAWSLHQDFKRDVVAILPRAGWQLTENEIRRSVASLART